MKQPCNTSAAIFDKAGVPSVSRQTRCNVLHDIAKNIKPITRPVLNKTHKEKRIMWAEKYMKTDFQQILFND